jgi:hypothetical protein
MLGRKSDAEVARLTDRGLDEIVAKRRELGR